MKILLDNEVNASVSPISQMNLYALINPDRSTVSDDENTPSANGVEGRNGRSPRIDWGRQSIFGDRVVGRCSSVVGGMPGCTGGDVLGICVAVGICRGVGVHRGAGAFNTQRTAIDIANKRSMRTSFCGGVEWVLGSCGASYVLDFHDVWQVACGCGWVSWFVLRISRWMGDLVLYIDELVRGLDVLTGR